MTDKTARGDSNERSKGSIVERAAKQVSSSLSANGTGLDEQSNSDAGTIATSTESLDERASVEENFVDELLPGIGTGAVPGGPAANYGPSSLPESVSLDTGHRSSNRDDAANATRDRSVNINFDINFPKLAAAGYVTPNQDRSRKTEEYRLIKRTILNRMNGAANSRSNLVLVSSALANEGKTYTAVNLAISISAEVNTSVLLIDADFNKRGATKVLGCPDKIGLIDVLENPDIDLADVLFKTNIPNLAFVPAGRPHQRSTELLAGARMAQLASEIGSRYDNRIIIFDCPPLLMTTEAAALTSHVGQVLFVIRAENTKENIVRQALELVDEKPEVGLILNRTHSRLGSAELGSNYEYYYDYGRE